MGSQMSNSPFRSSLHKTFTRSELYKRREDPLPYGEAAANARSFARIGPEPRSMSGTRVPEDREGCPTRLDGLEEESDI